MEDNGQILASQDAAWPAFIDYYSVRPGDFRRYPKLVAAWGHHKRIWDAATAQAQLAIEIRDLTPLPRDPKNQHAIEVPGFGWVAVKAVRAIERAHGIGEA